MTYKMTHDYSHSLCVYVWEKGRERASCVCVSDRIEFILHEVTEWRCHHFLLRDKIKDSKTGYNQTINKLRALIFNVG